MWREITNSKLPNWQSEMIIVSRGGLEPPTRFMLLMFRFWSNMADVFVN
jgi:hypothetical protein